MARAPAAPAQAIPLEGPVISASLALRSNNVSAHDVATWADVQGVLAAREVHVLRTTTCLESSSDHADGGLMIRQEVSCASLSCLLFRLLGAGSKRHLGVPSIA